MPMCVCVYLGEELAEGVDLLAERGLLLVLRSLLHVGLDLANLRAHAWVQVRVKVKGEGEGDGEGDGEGVGVGEGEGEGER